MTESPVTPPQSRPGPIRRFVGTLLLVVGLLLLALELLRIPRAMANVAHFMAIGGHRLTASSYFHIVFASALPFFLLITALGVLLLLPATRALFRRAAVALACLSVAWIVAVLIRLAGR